MVLGLSMPWAAAADDSPVGDWRGEFRLGEHVLPMALRIETDASGGYRLYEIDRDGQRLEKQDIMDAEIAPPSIRFRKQATPAALAFDGVIEGDGMSGALILEGYAAEVGSISLSRSK